MRPSTTGDERERPSAGPAEDGDSTKFITGSDNVVRKVLDLLWNARIKVDGVGNRDAPNLIASFEPYWNAIKAVTGRRPADGTRFAGRYITDIAETNIKACKRMADELGVELRHLDGIKSNILLTEREFAIDLSPPHPAGPSTRVLYSNSPELLEQQNQLFETLWSRSLPALERFRQIEEGRPVYETRVYRDANDIRVRTKNLVDRSTRYSASSGPRGLLYAFEQLGCSVEEVLARYRRGEHGGIRWLTTIDSSCLDIVRKFSSLGMEIRHAQAVPTENFGLSESEVMVAVSKSDGGTVFTNALFSNDPMYINHYESIFEDLWANGIDATVKIRELELGIEEPKMIVLRDPARIRSLYLQLVREAKDETLLILPSSNSYSCHVQAGMIDAMFVAASERGVKVKVLAPGDEARDAVRRFNQSILWNARASGSLVDIKTIVESKAPNTVIILVTDRSSSLIIEVQNDSEKEFDKTIGVATYSTRGSTVKANVRFFERMWQEESLLERERSSRREAELLQDILSHDIRNHNQIVQASAELLKELTESGSLSAPEGTHLIDDLLKAIARSNALIDRAKKLGKILSQERVSLLPIDVEAVLRRAAELVEKANPEKRVQIETKLQGGEFVVADDFLEDVFTNILSNSVKYTDGGSVTIEVESKKTFAEQADAASKQYWRLAFADHGRGIPDEQKPMAFTRYLGTASGSGLGLSIVYALVVERYSGMVRVRDRVPGDFRQGTVIEVFIPAAASSSSSPPGREIP